MKNILVAVASLILSYADEIEIPKHLGVLSPATALWLKENTTRPDFSHFEVEAVSLAGAATNVQRVFFTTTNALVTLTNLAALPPGRAMIGLVSASRDGTVSAAHFYSVDIQKEERLPAPSAEIVRILPSNRTGASNSVERRLEEIRQRPGPEPPPVPGQAPLPNAYLIPPKGTYPPGSVALHPPNPNPDMKRLPWRFIPPAEEWPIDVILVPPPEQLPHGTNQLYRTHGFPVNTNTIPPEQVQKMLEYYNRPGRRNER